MWTTAWKENNINKCHVIINSKYLLQFYSKDHYYLLSFYDKHILHFVYHNLSIYTELEYNIKCFECKQTLSKYVYIFYSCLSNGNWIDNKSGEKILLYVYSFVQILYHEDLVSLQCPLIVLRQIINTHIHIIYFLLKMRYFCRHTIELLMNWSISSTFHSHCIEKM